MGILIRCHKNRNVLTCCSYEATKQELEEFQSGSRDLEAELEALLEAGEKKNKELISANSRLTMELESLRVSCF